MPPKQTVSRAQRIVAVMPADDVLLLDTPRLTAARAQFVKAVPFALEDQLIAPVEDLHFAVPEKLAERVPVAIVSRKTLRAWIEQLAREIHGDLAPDCTLLLDLPVELGLERAKVRAGDAAADRFESERAPFFERVRAAYLELARTAPHRIKVIDASVSLANVETQVAAVLEKQA